MSRQPGKQGYVKAVYGRNPIDRFFDPKQSYRTVDILSKKDLLCKNSAFIMNYQKKETEGFTVKSIGIVRKIDGVGRIALPIEFKDSVGVIRNSFVEIAGREDGIVIKKLPACAFCGSDKDLITFRGKQVCRTCLEKIKRMNKTM